MESLATAELTWEQWLSQRNPNKRIYWRLNCTKTKMNKRWVSWISVMQQQYNTLAHPCTNRNQRFYAKKFLMWLLFDKGTGLINVRLCFWYDFLDTLSCRTAGQLSSHYGCSWLLISSIPPSEHRGLDREERNGRKWHLVLQNLGEHEQKDQLKSLSRTSWWSEAGAATCKGARWEVGPPRRCVLSGINCGSPISGWTQVT